MFDQNPEFTRLLQEMSELIYVPVDAREQFDAMLRQNFTGSTNGDVCHYCEAHPGDNDHCVGDGSAHTWHVCGDAVRTAFIDSNCPEAV